ncbi:pilus assembly protein [uncultured Jannaschia sp.]|uniref:Flp family type IVb pilin n=1 Tax=uncultured Jannaschia sp. TaxID=293347 RepID=UPI0026138C28|nr:pilus assembly protein [uncultured Jannaschia sp.]
MLNAINTFKNDESGAVTVDWVVLTAALVGLGLAVMGVVSQGVQDISGDIKGQLETDMIGAGFGAAGTGLDLTK